MKQASISSFFKAPPQKSATAAIFKPTIQVETKISKPVSADFNSYRRPVENSKENACPIIAAPTLPKNPVESHEVSMVISTQHIVEERNLNEIKLGIAEIRDSTDASPPRKKPSPSPALAHPYSQSPSPSPSPALTPSPPLSSNPTSPLSHPPVNLGITDYERLRQDNIQRNEAFLRSLGLDSLKPAVNDSHSHGSKQCAKKRSRPLPPPPSAPSRRSARVANGPPQPVYIDSNVVDIVEEEEEEEEEVYDDSTVLKYIMASDFSTSIPIPHTQQDLNNLGNMRLCITKPTTLSSPDLTAIYSMDFHRDPSLLLAAGKGGVVALFKIGGAREDKGVAISFRAHQRWIAAAKFLYFSAPSISTATSSDRLHIITASDDGSMKIWDLSKVNKRLFPALMTTSTPHTGKGIFALDCQGGLILTGSKDKDIVLSGVTEGCDVEQLRRFEWHGGCVKSVAWRVAWSENGCTANNNAGDASSCTSSSSNLFASGGQDRLVCVKDVRSHSSRADIELQNVHEGGVHAVSWAGRGWKGSNELNPAADSNAGSREYFLLTAGADSVIKVFDIRSPRRELLSSSPACSPGESENKLYSPVHILRGHHYHGGPAGKTYKTIISPKFLSDCAIITPGERSSYLTVYNAITGSTICRGEMPDVPMTVSVGGPGGNECVAVAGRGGVIHVCSPVL